MNNSVIEALYMVFGAVVFSIAMYFLVMTFTRLDKATDTYAQSMNEKPSITMENNFDMNIDHLTCNGSDILANILSIDDSENYIPVYLDGVLISQDELKEIKRKNPAHINSLRSRISLNDSYKMSYSYDLDNNVTEVYYTKE